MNMSNLKNLFNNVLDTVTEKGKEYAEKGKEYADIALDKTKIAGRTAKLGLEIATEKETLRKAYTELGQLYYESCAETAEGVFAPVCQEIEAIALHIQELEAERDCLKAELKSKGEPDVDISFEEVVEEDEKQGDAADVVVKVVVETAETVAEKVEDVAEKVEDVVENVVEKITGED